MSSLSRRVPALETARVDLIYRREAERVAAESGRPVATILAELRATAAEIIARFGPRPDMRAVAEWAAREHGLDPEKIYADMMALKEKR